METSGQPVVFGSKKVEAGLPTVLIYGHYDVQPPDPYEEWESPPFEPTRRNGNVYARGATDDKGQMLTHIKSVQSWMQTAGNLPLNIKFLIEGEEEVGSCSLEWFVERNQEKLGESDHNDNRDHPATLAAFGLMQRWSQPYRSIGGLRPRNLLRRQVF